MAKPTRYSHIERTRKALGIQFRTRIPSLLRQRNYLSILHIQKSILAAQALRRCVELEAQLEQALATLEQFGASSGCCMCGSEEGHCDPGHSFTDSGVYNAGKMVEQINTLLSKGLRDHQHGLTVNELRQALNFEKWTVAGLLHLLGDVQEAFYRWQNGHGFDSHGKDREIEERINDFRRAKN